MHAHTPDGELVSLIASGGPAGRAAENELCRRFATRVRLYGIKHLKNPTRADDLTQSVLLGVLTAAREGRIAELDKVDRFVLGTCRNVALRMRQTDARAEPTPPESLPEPVVEPFQMIDERALIRCLDTLESRAQQVVRLSFNEERSSDEIAALLATTPGNVRVLRYRALAALRRCLDTAEGAAP